MISKKESKNLSGGNRARLGYDLILNVVIALFSVLAPPENIPAENHNYTGESGQWDNQYIKASGNKLKYPACMKFKTQAPEVRFWIR